MSDTTKFPDPVYRDTVLAPLFDAAKDHYAGSVRAINQAHLVMLAETGIALLSCDKPGGIGTPGSFLGEALVERLREHADLTFAVED